jgi:hypothetical protein
MERVADVYPLCATRVNIALASASERIRAMEALGEPFAGAQSVGRPAHPIGSAPIHHADCHVQLENMRGMRRGR